MSAVVAYRSSPRRISLTPLIDVVFILLMFFMLTSSFIQWQQIELTTPRAPASAAAAEPALVARLDTAGQLAIHGAVFPAQDLSTEQLAGIPGYSADRALVVVPAAEVPVQRVVDTLERLAAAGVTRLTLGSED